MNTSNISYQYPIESDTYPVHLLSKTTPSEKSLQKRKSITDDYSDEESRQKILERNRLAASKCRQRKKQWVEELIKKSEKLSRQNEYLKQVVLQLREETDYLKMQMTQSCQCKTMRDQTRLYMIESMPIYNNSYPRY